MHLVVHLERIYGKPAIAILAIYHFDAMFDTESGLPKKCKHCFAQLGYSWQFC